MRHFLSAFAVTAVMAFAPLAAHAQTETYNLETPHTQVMFSVFHMGLSHSNGKFLGYNGTLVIDHDHKEKSTVDVTIKTDSLEMGDKTWNEHVKGENLFNAAKFPEMTFKSTKVTLTGDKTADILGDLTLLGVTKPVTLHATFNDAKQNPMGKDFRIGFSATGTLKRSDFGMSYGIPMVSDDVNLAIEVEAIRKETEENKK